MPNISLEAVDIINYKLNQADAVTTLLICDCDSDSPINKELRSDALGAISDLITDSKKLFRAETERKESVSKRLT